MDDFVKKFYWLILTSVLSGFIILSGSTHKAWDNIPFEFLFSYNKKEISKLTDSVLQGRDLRKHILEKMYNDLRSKTYDTLPVSSILANSVKYDREIKIHIAYTETLIAVSEKYRGTENIITDIFRNFQNLLLAENDIWNYVGDSFLIYRQDKNQWSKAKFKIGLERLINKYEAQEERLRIRHLEHIDISDFQSRLIKDLIKFVFLTISSAGLLVFIVFYIVPIGILLWNEKFSK